MTVYMFMCLQTAEVVAAADSLYYVELVCFRLRLHESTTGMKREAIFHAFLAHPDCQRSVRH